MCLLKDDEPKKTSTTQKSKWLQVIGKQQSAEKEKVLSEVNDTAM